jgi:2,4-dienoyl-CoA reductase-like NADH-dependent reductase (Old Yellow Enzyme family)
LAFTFGSRAAGGAGLIIQEATSVSPEGISRRSRPWKEHIEKLAQINQFIVSQNSVPEFNWRMLVEKLAQHLHGMVTKGADQGGWDSVAPSGIAIMNQKKHLLHLKMASIK